MIYRPYKSLEFCCMTFLHLLLCSLCSPRSFFLNRMARIAHLRKNQSVLSRRPDYDVFIKVKRKIYT